MQMNGRKKIRQKQESFLFILMGLILLGLLVSGYFLFVEKVLPGLTSNKAPASQNAQGGQSSGQNSSVVDGSGQVAEEPGQPLFPGDAQEIVLYFGEKGKDTLIREVKKIPAEKMILTLAGSIVQNLISGPSLVQEARPIIPTGTQLRSLFYHQGTFFVDFSPEFIENHPGGALEEVLTVFSIVNSLTELDKKAKVRILVNGHEEETLKGHISLKQIFSRNETLMSSVRGS